MRLLAGIATTLLLALPLEAVPGSSWRPARRRPLGISTSEARSVQYGLASWYGARFRGRLTASGTPFDDNKLTAAHRTLPLGTKVKVTNLKNGRSVVLRVTDRGPYVRGRLIDVSHAAADCLGFMHRGLAHVRVAVVRGAHETPRSSSAAALEGNDAAARRP